jgi:uncharacterized DUF497 family protein
MLFDWDDANILHLARHDITPDEAEQVIQNVPVDLDESYVDGEHRFTLIGETRSGRVVTLVATLRDSQVRVITGWDSEAKTKRNYFLEKGRQHGHFT